MLTIPPDQIGFDFDGVIADIGETFIRLACREHGYCSLDVNNIKTFQVEECLDIPLEVVVRIFEDILQDSINTGLKPIAGAIETLTRLSSRGSVTIITARPEIDPVRKWLDHYCGLETSEKITLVTSGDHDDKERYIRQHNLSYFVDDRAHTCVQLSEAGLTPVVFSQPWNQNGHNLQSVENWTEVQDLILPSPEKINEMSALQR